MGHALQKLNRLLIPARDKIKLLHLNQQLASNVHMKSKSKMLLILVSLAMKKQWKNLLRYSESDTRPRGVC